MKKLIFLLLVSTSFQTYSKQEKKDWTFIAYIAADNDLDYFSMRNIDDMKKVGSTKHINIIAQVDRQGAHETTKRLYIEKNKAIQVNTTHPSGAQKLDFGSALTLIDCLDWAIEDYPAEHYALILWNHGIGILDNIAGRTTAPSDFFIFNTETNMLEINRTIEYLEYLRQKNELRGICFGDTYGTYLTNQRLHYALQEAHINFLKGKKIDIIGFDACLMSMIEVGNLIRPYSDFMVSSQELELGTGWPYHKVLEPFLTKTLSPEEFASHIVQVYHDNYKTITYDYTLSAVNLTMLGAVEEHLDSVVNLLCKALVHQKNNTVAKLIKASRSKRLCTYFSEPSYIDLHHFLSNIAEILSFMALEEEHVLIKQELKKTLVLCLDAIKKSVIANQCGKNLSQAKGLSIYFPLHFIDQSYFATPFASSCAWISLLKEMREQG